MLPSSPGDEEASEAGLSEERGVQKSQGADPCGEKAQEAGAVVVPEEELEALV